MERVGLARDVVLGRVAQRHRLRAWGAVDEHVRLPGVREPSPRVPADARHGELGGINPAGAWRSGTCDTASGSAQDHRRGDGEQFCAIDFANENAGRSSRLRGALHGGVARERGGGAIPAVAGSNVFRLSHGPPSTLPRFTHQGWQATALVAVQRPGPRQVTGSCPNNRPRSARAATRLANSPASLKQDPFQVSGAAIACTRTSVPKRRAA